MGRSSHKLIHRLEENLFGPSNCIKCPRRDHSIDPVVPGLRNKISYVYNNDCKNITVKIGRCKMRFRILKTDFRYELLGESWATLRIRTAYECDNCGFNFDHIMEGVKPRSRFVDDNRFKLFLFLGLALIAGLTISICTAVYQWKQVEMARNGYEEVTVPNYNGTTTDWRKTKGEAE